MLRFQHSYKTKSIQDVWTYSFRALKILYSIFGVLIIPKWLIKFPGHIPIPFGWFLELPTCLPNLAPYTIFITRKTSTNTRKYGIIFKTYCFFIYHDFGTPTISKFRHYLTSKLCLHRFRFLFLLLFAFWGINLVGPKRLVSSSAFKKNVGGGILINSGNLKIIKQLKT